MEGKKLLLPTISQVEEKELPLPIIFPKEREGTASSKQLLKWERSKCLFQPSSKKKERRICQIQPFFPK
jgi:hypothetical protein